MAHKLKRKVVYLDAALAEDQYRLICNAMEAIEAGLVAAEQVRQFLKQAPFGLPKANRAPMNLSPEERSRRAQQMRENLAKRKAQRHD